MPLASNAVKAYMRTVTTTSVLLWLACALTVGACSSDSTSTPATPTVPLSNTTFSGTVPALTTQCAPLAGTTTCGFFVTTSTGTSTFTLTTANQTTGSVMLANVSLGIQIGTAASGSCSVSGGTGGYSVLTVNVSQTASLNAGSYCLQATEVTGQSVSYVLQVQHP